jgi:hypothetical protein
VRAIVIWASIATFGVLVCVAMALVYGAPAPVRGQRDTFLAGPFDPNWTFTCGAALGVIALCGVLIAAWWHATGSGARLLLGFWSIVGVLIALPALGFVGFVGAVGDTPYTEIPASVAGRGLVVREYGVLRAGGAHVYEREGVVLRWIATLPAAGRAAQPFRAGDYDVVRSGDHVVLRWTTEDGPGSAWFRLP